MDVPPAPEKFENAAAKEVVEEVEDGPQES